jgi:hypothetical protein
MVNTIVLRDVLKDTTPLKVVDTRVAAVRRQGAGGRRQEENGEFNGYFFLFPVPCSLFP